MAYVQMVSFFIKQRDYMKIYYLFICRHAALYQSKEISGLCLGHPEADPRPGYTTKALGCYAKAWIVKGLLLLATIW